MKQSIILELDKNNNIREWCKKSLADYKLSNGSFYYLMNGAPKPNNIEHVIVTTKTIEDLTLFELTWSQYIVIRFND
jgi:hypothetical protein